MPVPFSPLKRFGIGVGLSSVMTLTFFLTSMYATHTPLQQMGMIQFAIAIGLPLICGGLAAMKSDRFLDALANVLEKTSL